MLKIAVLIVALIAFGSCATTYDFTASVYATVTCNTTVTISVPKATVALNTCFNASQLIPGFTATAQLTGDAAASLTLTTYPATTNCTGMSVVSFTGTSGTCYPSPFGATLNGTNITWVATPAMSSFLTFSAAVVAVVAFATLL